MESTHVVPAVGNRIFAILALVGSLIPLPTPVSADTIGVSDCLFARRGKLALGVPQCIKENADDSDENGGLLAIKITIGHLGGLDWTPLPAFLREPDPPGGGVGAFSDVITGSVDVGILSDDIFLRMTSGGPPPPEYAPEKALVEENKWIDITLNVFPLLDQQKQPLTIWAWSDPENSHVMPLPLPKGQFDVPEPMTLTVLSLGMTGLLLRLLRKR